MYARAGMHAGALVGVGLLAVAAGSRLLAQEPPVPRTAEAEQTLRQEGEAVVALADAAARGQSVPSDFSLAWHNDFLKAQSGTFIPFIVRLSAPQLERRAALLYVRLSRQTDPHGEQEGRRRADAPAFVFHPFEEIYPIELVAATGHPVRIARGFSVQPGEYDLTVVVRERERRDDAGRPRLAAVLRRPLSVPDFSPPDLAMSSVMVADRLDVLAEPPPPGHLPERPYVIGNREVHPAADAVFGPNEELIVVFLVYNPALRGDKHFDLEVEYHFFRTTGGEEAYFNRTEPQRFGRDLLGPAFDPSVGQPVMAGQGVPLAGFPQGDYRLMIRVKDLVSGRSLERRVAFTVRS